VSAALSLFASALTTLGSPSKVFSLFPPSVPPPRRVSSTEEGPAPGAILPHRRQLLSGSVLSVLTLPPLILPGPASAEEKSILETNRLALYKGKATSLRAAAEWYRFSFGDLIATGSALRTTTDCGGGFCPEALALQKAEKLISPGMGRNGIASFSPVEASLITPMSYMTNLAVWDPDTDDVARLQVEDFVASIQRLGENIRSNPTDGSGVQQIYAQSLEKLNVFFRTANEASGATVDEDRFLPLLPLSQSEEESSDYWQAERKAFLKARDPVAEFQERNAFGSRELRQGLKRFPGATLLLR